jgi:hypothetical protein
VGQDVVGRDVVGRDEARIWFVRFLLRKVRADTYPSATQMDLIETVIPRYMLDEYLRVLVDKVDDDRYPSIDLLRRIKRVIECLPLRYDESDEEPAAEAAKA